MYPFVIQLFLAAYAEDISDLWLYLILVLGVASTLSPMAFVKYAVTLLATIVFIFGFTFVFSKAIEVIKDKAINVILRNENVISILALIAVTLFGVPLYIANTFTVLEEDTNYKVTYGMRKSAKYKECISGDNYSVKELAIGVLNTIVSQKNQGNAFTTLDMCVVDLYSGMCELHSK